LQVCAGMSFQTKLKADFWLLVLLLYGRA